MSRLRTWLLLVVGLIGPMTIGGCHPWSMGIFTPIPVMPWMTEQMLDKYQYKNDYRTPVLGPIRDGFPPPMCEDPPDDSSVLRAMPRVARGVPYVYEEFRDDIQVVTELLVDKVDPPRFFPLVGPAQLHHCHWKCTIYYIETVESGYPVPFRVRRPRVQVIYMDKDHLHSYPCGSCETNRQFSRDLNGQ